VSFIGDNQTNVAGNWMVATDKKIELFGSGNQDITNVRQQLFFNRIQLKRWHCLLYCPP